MCWGGYGDKLLVSTEYLSFVLLFNVTVRLVLKLVLNLYCIGARVTSSKRHFWGKCRVMI